VRQRLERSRATTAEAAEGAAEARLIHRRRELAALGQRGKWRLLPTAGGLERNHRRIVAAHLLHGGGGGGEPLSLTARELASALYPFSSLAGGRAAVAAIRLHRAAERDRGERAESVLAAAAGGDDGPAPRRCRGSPSRACAWFATARTLRAGRSSPRAVACGRSFAPRWAS